MIKQLFQKILSICFNKKYHEIRAIKDKLFQYRTVFENANDAIYLFELTDEGMPGKFIEVNQTACNRFGYSKQELLQMSPTDITVKERLSKLPSIQQEVLDKGHLIFEGAYVSKEGLRIPSEISVRMITLENKKVGLAISRDITERKQMEDTITRLAYHDPLTGLPNRNLFSERIAHALRSTKENHHSLAVIFIDLDRFKLINDTLGHDIGDSILKMVAERLRSCLSEDDFLSRLGGDEFTIFVQNTSEKKVEKLAHMILSTMNRAFVVKNHELYITPSLGISIFPTDGENEESLIKHADIAMNRAKELGKNNYQFFHADMYTRSLQEIELEMDLRKALERNELSLYYQPKYNIAKNRVVGMEALIRWQHPELGFISPMNFIPLAEETGLIVPIGEWVIRNACNQNKRWIDAGIPPMRIAVNISLRQFYHPEFVQMVSQAIQESGLDPKYLELEITESMTINVEHTISVLHDLKKLGVSIAMDDFGTGYSSLNHLKKFPVDLIKIDQSFVKDFMIDSDDAKIIKTIIVMAHSLHLNVIAEGVETEEQMNHLKHLGCNEIQGYFICKPLPVEQIENWLSSVRPIITIQQKIIPHTIK